MSFLSPMSGKLVNVEVFNRRSLRRLKFYCTRNTGLFAAMLVLLVGAPIGQAQTPPVAPAAATPATVTPAVSGKYNPNFGFKVADTPEGDLSISVYTYARY